MSLHLKGIVQIYLIEDLKIYTFFNNSSYITKMLIANSAGLQLQRNIGVG